MKNMSRSSFHAFDSCQISFNTHRNVVGKFKQKNSEVRKVFIVMAGIKNGGNTNMAVFFFETIEYRFECFFLSLER